MHISPLHYLAILAIVIVLESLAMSDNFCEGLAMSRLTLRLKEKTRPVTEQDVSDRLVSTAVSAASNDKLGKINVKLESVLQYVTFESK